MSRANVDFVVGLLVKHPPLFDEVMEMVFRNEEPLSRRAIWVVDHYSEQHPKLMEAYLQRLYEAIPSFEHDGLKRHSLRILHRFPIQEKQMAGLLDLCFKFLLSSKESIAVKLFSIHILYAISQKEPDIKPELATAIEFQIMEASAGMKNIGRRILSKLYNEIAQSKPL